jgi:hypothetical protein
VLRVLRRYWPTIPIAVILALAVHQEWLNKTTPQPPLSAAAPQIPALAASQPAPNDVGIQAAPKSETPAANAHPTTNAQPQPEPSDATGNGAVNHDAHTAKNHGGSNTKPAHDLFDYASLLLPFLVGAATVMVLILQLCLLRKADRTAVLGTKIAARQMRIAGAQADILVEQKQLGRQLFFAEHRPNLEVRFARLLPSNPVSTGRPKRTFIEFSVINTGTSAAKITGSRVRLDWLESPADVPNPDDIGGADIIPHNRMIASARIRCPMEIEDSFRGGFSETPDKRLSQSTLILFGWIVYEDDRGSEFGTTRTTYFCQMLDNSSGSFKPAESLPDWNFIH